MTLAALRHLHESRLTVLLEMSRCSRMSLELLAEHLDDDRPIHSEAALDFAEELSEDSRDLLQRIENCSPFEDVRVISHLSCKRLLGLLRRPRSMH
jgi:hypothetical protein